MLPPDAQATVVIEGTSPAQMITFGFPEPWLPTLSIGTVDTGPTASASIIGVPPNFILNLTLPDGSGTGNPNYTTSFVVQPGNWSGWVGDEVVLSASAQSTDPPISYKWQRLNVGIWQDIPGANGGTYKFVPVDPLDSGEFRCVATTLHTIAWSNSAVVTVTDRPPSDGTSWTGSHNAWFNGKITYRVGTNVMFYPQAITSDGAQWKNIGSSVGTLDRPEYGNGFFHTGSMLSGATGDSWTSALPGSPVTSTRPTTWKYGLQGNRFLGVYGMTPQVRPGDTAPSPTAGLFATSDGFNYSQITVTPPAGMTEYAFLSTLTIHSFGSIWIGCCVHGGNDRLVYSTNGSIWAFASTGSDMGVHNNLYPVSFASTPTSPWQTVAIKQGIQAWVTQTGINWTVATLPTSAHWSDVQCGKNGAGSPLFMACAKNSRSLITSLDGSNWVLAGQLPENGNWHSLAYFSNRWWCAKNRQQGELYTVATSG